MSRFEFEERGGPGDAKPITFAPDEPSLDLTRRTQQAFLAPQKQNLPALVMVGRVAASRQVTICHPNSTDGSQVPCGLVYSDQMADLGVRMAGIYISGTFDPDEIAIGAGWTLEAATLALRKVGITIAAREQVIRVYSV